MSEEYDYKGGEQEYGGDGPNLRYDDFVRRIVQDTNDPPSVTLLSGYLGSSSEEGHVRLYLDEELSRYVEIPEKAVRHTQELSPEQSPLGGSLVWIDRDAEVLHGAAGSGRRKATFLEGQIAQDYMGGGFGYLSGGITTQTRQCVGPPPTSVGPSCAPSQYGPCIPRTELLGCRTRTGILCTRIGPGCGLTSFDPVCTVSGQQCHTALPHQCPSVFSPCVTQNQSYCVASGYVPCNPPIDFTIYEQPGVQQQFGQPAPFAGGGFGFGAAQGFGGAAALPQTLTKTCQTVYRCISVVIRCPTVNQPICYFTQAANCPDTRAGCQFQSAACGVDPAGGYDPAGGFAQGFGAEAYAKHPTQPPVCDTRTPDCGNAPTLTRSCQGFGGGVGYGAALPQTLSRTCQTMHNCPTLPNGCPGYTRPGACETFGPCPSAVDACPTRLGCYNTAYCGASVACYPGGGYEPGGF